MIVDIVRNKTAPPVAHSRYASGCRSPSSVELTSESSTAATRTRWWSTGRTAIVTDAAPDPPPLDDAPDWDRVVALARYHGIVQLLYEGLEAMARESGDEFTVPAAVLTRLQHRQGKRMRNLAFTTELQEILERFEPVVCGGPQAGAAAALTTTQLCVAVAVDARDAEHLALADIERHVRDGGHAAVVRGREPLHREHLVARLRARSGVRRGTSLARWRRERPFSRLL